MYIINNKKYIEYDEHVGIAQLYFPQLMRDIKINNELTMNSYILIKVFINKYFESDASFISLLEKVNIEELNSKNNKDIFIEIYNLLELNFKHTYNDEYSPYSNRDIFN